MQKEINNPVYKLLVSAGEAITGIYQSTDFNIEIKSDNSPVTLADKKSSEIINEGLRNNFPGIPVIDEETRILDYELRKNWCRFFLVDPLDGTKEFIRKNGEFCINLALVENGRPVEGWIYQPLTKTGWHGKKGEGITEFRENGATKKIKNPMKNQGPIRIVASRSFFNQHEARLIDKIKKYFPVEVIHKGSSAKQVALVLGLADIYLKSGPCSEWDTAAGQIMVEESGGIVFRQDNFQPLRYNKPNLLNPHFVMLSRNMNTPDFVGFIQTIIKDEK